MSSKICRLCLSDHLFLYDVFEYIKEELLPEKILRCTSVEVLKDDGLPNTTCTNCIQMIMQFDLFRKQCQYSDSIIRNNHRRNSNIKPEFNNEHLIEGKHRSNQTNDAVVSKNVYTENDLNSKVCTDIEYKKTHYRNLRSDTPAKNNLVEETENKISEINHEVNVEYVSDDDNISDKSENLNDPDYNPLNDADCIPDKTTWSPKNTSLGKKKCKIKRKSNEMQQDDGGRHHLIYSERDYAILGRERKVRIYEMDDTMREIIGNNVYTCEVCMAEFTSFFDYYDHQETHNGEPLFKCSKCNAVFSNRENLVEHDARHKIPCKICELEVLPKSMSAHLLIHTDVHKCPDCGMRHTSNASLEKHIKARHTGIKGFVCHVCGKQSSCQSSMNRHMAYHSTERPYKCKYCDFCAKSLNIVQVHTSRKHFAEKCVCEICAKLFKSQPSLIQHMKRIHTARKHICDICGKAFIERYNLNRHLKKHAGQRLHECKLCHKEFFTIRKLKEHMHSHRQGCVNCPKCGKEFFYKKYYTKHVLKCTKADEFNSVIVYH